MAGVRVRPASLCALWRGGAQNHLDFASLEVLEAALRDYPGAIVAVSHDRAFLEAIGTDRLVRVSEGAVVETT